VRTRDDVLTCARHIHSDALAPIFLTSSVTGTALLMLYRTGPALAAADADIGYLQSDKPYQSHCASEIVFTRTGEGLELVRLFYSLLPLRQKWHERSSAATEFLIDETFRCCAVLSVQCGLFQDLRNCKFDRNVMM
jgi:GTPase